MSNNQSMNLSAFDANEINKNADWNIRTTSTNPNSEKYNNILTMNYPFITLKLDGVKIISEGQIELIKFPVYSSIDSMREFFHYGKDRYEQSYLMIKINLAKSHLNNNPKSNFDFSYDSFVQKYLIDLENINSNKYFLYYYGLYFDSLSHSHYLIFEHSACDYDKFRELALISFNNHEKFLFFKQILKTFVFLTENSLIYPLIKNMKFFYVKESKSNFYTFKLLYIGQLISFTNHHSNTIDLPDLLDYYRSSLIELMETFRINFNLTKIQLDKINEIDEEVIKRFYMHELSKLILKTYLKKKNTSDEQIRKLRTYPKEIPIEFKDFVLINLNPITSSIIQVKFEDPLNIFDNYLKKNGDVLDVEEYQLIDSTGVNEMNKGQPPKEDRQINLKIENFSSAILIQKNAVHNNPITSKLLKTKRDRIEIEQPSDMNSIPQITNIKLNTKNVEVVDLTAEDIPENLKRVRFNANPPIKEEIVILDTNSSVKSSTDSIVSIDSDEYSNIYLLNRSRCSKSKVAENSKLKYPSNNYSILIDQIDISNEIIIEDKNNNEIPSTKKENSQKEKVQFMILNFKGENEEIFNYYYKPFSEEFRINAISRHELPKLIVIDKRQINKTTKTINNINPATLWKLENTYKESQNNYNININMTNVIINTSNNNSQSTPSQVILENLNKNILNELSQKHKHNFHSENKEMLKIWSDIVLPESEVFNWISEIKRCWPFDRIDKYYEDLALKFLVFCNYDVFKSLNHIENCSVFFKEFCHAHNLMHKTGNLLKNNKRESINSIKRNKNNKKKIFTVTKND